MKSNAQTSSNSAQLLSAQRITPDGPGTILRDVEMIIKFIGEAGIPTSSKLGNLPSEPLAALNAMLSFPIDMPLKRPLLTSYPNISGIYILLRVMALVRVEGKRVLLDRGTLALWRGLNPAEQYFALLEAWLWHADAKVVGEEAPRWGTQHYLVSQFLKQLRSTKWKKFNELAHMLFIPGAISKWNVFLMQQFGIVDLEALPLEGPVRPGHGNGWLLGKARLTLWGAAVSHTLSTNFVAKEYYSAAGETPDFGKLAAAFSPYFPELEKAFQVVLPAEAVGTYIYKASFGRGSAPLVSCLLAVPSEAMLAELAEAVLEAFSFWDNAHMYDFKFRDHLGKPIEVRCPHSEEGPWADTTPVSKTHLPMKGIMKFCFDYGASWEFDLQLVRIDPPGERDAGVQLIKLTGTPPKQYQEW